MCQNLLCASVWVMAKNKTKISFPMDLIFSGGDSN